MARIVLTQGLPFVEVTLKANGKSIVLPHVLIDTGSAACAFKTDDLTKVDVHLQMTDKIVFLTGIGDGREVVVKKQIDALAVENMVAAPFTIQIGALDYGFKLDGIIGSDFLIHVSAVLDFETLEMRKKGA